jgi:hypothetical protein
LLGRTYGARVFVAKDAQTTFGVVKWFTLAVGGGAVAFLTRRSLEGRFKALAPAPG